MSMYVCILFFPQKTMECSIWRDVMHLSAQTYCKSSGFFKGIIPNLQYLLLLYCSIYFCI